MRADLLPRLDHLERLLRRVLTPAGVRVALPVTAAATTVAVTWPRAEGDATYGVLATPSWLTTVRVTSKTTTGCVIDFGTAAPGSATVDVFTFRNEG